ALDQRLLGRFIETGVLEDADFEGRSGPHALRARVANSAAEEPLELVGRCHPTLGLGVLGRLPRSTDLDRLGRLGALLRVRLEEPAIAGVDELGEGGEELLAVAPS